MNPRPLSKRNADALARVVAGPVLASELHATALWVLWCRGLVDLRFDSPDGGPVGACAFGDFPPVGSWAVLATASSEVALEQLVRQHASICDPARFPAAYEFASMLEGYDPARWRELAASRGLHPITGKPKRTRRGES